MVVALVLLQCIGGEKCPVAIVTLVRKMCGTLVMLACFSRPEDAVTVVALERMLVLPVLSQGALGTERLFTINTLEAVYSGLVAIAPPRRTEDAVTVGALESRMCSLLVLS